MSTVKLPALQKTAVLLLQSHAVHCGNSSRTA